MTIFINIVVCIVAVFLVFVGCGGLAAAHRTPHNKVATRHHRQRAMMFFLGSAVTLLWFLSGHAMAVAWAIVLGLGRTVAVVQAEELGNQGDKERIVAQRLLFVTAIFTIGIFLFW